MTTARFATLLLTLGLWSSSVPGCNALLENDPVTFDPSIGGMFSGEAGSTGSGGAHSGGTDNATEGGARNEGGTWAEGAAPSDGGSSGSPAGGTAQTGGSAGETASGGQAGGVSTGCDALNPACVTGESRQISEKCGNCSTGTRTGTQKCNPTSCQFDPPTDWTACSGVTAACAPNAKKEGSRACGNCNTGTQKTEQKCTESCTWGAVQDVGQCTGVTAPCSAGQKSACANGDSCGERTCSASCTWSACAPKTGAQCLRIHPQHSDEGSNYRCCQTKGEWQFCLSSCKWSDQCGDCAQTNCPNCY